MNSLFKKIIYVAGGATFLSLFFVAQDYFFVITVDREIDIIANLTYELTYYYTWAILLVGIIPFTNKFRLEKKKFLKNLPIHILAALIFSIIHRVASFILYLLLTSPGHLIGGVPVWQSPKIIGGSFNSFLNFWIIIGLYYGLSYYRQFREEKIKSVQLEAELANSQLQSLKMQLQPHFLFNTLHAVSSLMDEDVHKARKTLALLSNLLRQSLDTIGKQFTTLKEEIDFLRGYLEIEQTRFQERLKVVFEMEDNLLDLQVPNLILQPLVENAVKHGIATKSEGGTIIIKGIKRENKLMLSVKDDGKSSNAPEKNKGIGLNNVQRRLEKIYGDKSNFQIKNGNGFEVIITIPTE